MVNCRQQHRHVHAHIDVVYIVCIYIYIKIHTYKPISFSSVPESSFVGILILDILFVNRGPGDWSISLTSMDDEASSCELRLGPLSILLLPNSLLKNDIICDISNTLL